LSCAFRRHLYGQTAPGLPSRFLADIPQALIQAPQAGNAPAPPPRAGYAERLARRQVEAASPARPVVQRYVEGETVEHPAFGRGVVVKSTLTRSDEELLVKFDRAGLKILSGSLAPLTKR
jgi:DNA helicase-2/ATP-dependent DNA helicase PcrA